MSYLFESEYNVGQELWSPLWGDVYSLWQPSHFTPAEPFRGGVNGVWFDFSDLGVMFQDAYGLVPVTAADQPVGLVLDKSVIQRHPARRNLARYSEQIDVNWQDVTSQVTHTQNAAASPIGDMTADNLYFDSASNGYSYQKVYTAVTTNRTYTFSAYVWNPVVSGKTNIGIRIANNNGADAAYVSATLTTTPTRVSVTKVFSTDIGEIHIGFENRPMIGGGDGGVGNVYVWGAQLEVGSTPTAYQKVTTGLGDWTPGNHASQTADSKRLMLRSDGRLWWADYDEIDDVINVAFSSAPGVCTAVENRLDGVVVTTGVNIATTTYALPVNDNYGVVIIPGTLSADNLNRLTCYFNQQAGR